MHAVGTAGGAGHAASPRYAAVCFGTTLSWNIRGLVLNTTHRDCLAQYLWSKRSRLWSSASGKLLKRVPGAYIASAGFHDGFPESSAGSAVPKCGQYSSLHMRSSAGGSIGREGVAEWQDDAVLQSFQ